MIKRSGLFLPLLMVLALTAGCATRDPYSPIQDLVSLKQDAGAYNALAPDKRLISKEEQDQSWNGFLEMHFDPWERTEPEHTAKEVFWGLAELKGKPLFGENTLPRDPRWLKGMADASRVDAYPSLCRPAISVTNLSLRVLPTDHPAFLDFRKPGQGYPFDYMQNSLVLAGTPLLATHVSADGGWVLVESRVAYGWVHARDIAWVDPAFMKAYRTGAYVTPTRDFVPVKDLQGHYCFMDRMGSILPVDDHLDKDFTVLVPVRDDQGRAVLHRAKLSRDDVRMAPIPATPANFAAQANQLMGQQYGWGGLYADRDCSSTTMDLMAGFGIYLPRNSAQQAQAGEIMDLEGLTPKAKKTFILKNAVPFLTLVRTPGHIMLYIGSKNGEPVVLHTTWGLKTRTGSGYGRKVLGGTVITTLEPGRELHNLAKPRGLLLNSVQSIVKLP